MDQPVFETRRNGYDQNQVDTWSRQALAEYHKAQQDADWARRELERMQSERADTHVNVEAIGKALASAHAEAERIVAEARRDATREAEQARREVADEVARLQRERDELIGRVERLDEALVSRQQVVIEVLDRIKEAVSVDQNGEALEAMLVRTRSNALADQLGLEPEKASDLAAILNPTTK